MDLSQALQWMGRLEHTLARLDVLPRKVSEIAAPEITKALQREFAQGADPYGRKWRKLATGKPSHLTESGRLRRGTRAAPLPGRRAGVRILLGAKYAVFHQTGTAHMPARKILPERGMPASWNVAINRAMRKAFAEVVR
jgi:hypothetical protein